MSTNNGPKQFIYTVRVRTVEEGVEQRQQLFLIRSDRDPDRDELIHLLKLELDDQVWTSIDCQRYDLDKLPVLPPKGWTSV